jgi:hypothetical protein
VKPTKSILDKSFDYTPSHRTDVKKTIERAREKQKEEAAARLRNVISNRRFK